MTDVNESFDENAWAANRPQERLVWIDCEMTGLDVENDVLVEIAVIVTEADLTPLDDGIDIVIKTTPEKLAGMDPFVVNMHSESGLLPLIPEGEELSAAEQRVLDYVKQHVPEARKAPLAGSSVYVDRMYLARYMPQLDAHLHYRLVDVSTVKELTRRWYPRVYFNSPKKVGGHRALGDILDSIRELRYYRSMVFAAQPGPDTAAAKAASSNFTGTGK
ncbi:MAG: oligoribonuclease [Candidatus Nanopelagicales bacterium]